MKTEIFCVTSVACSTPADIARSGDGELRCYTAKALTGPGTNCGRCSGFVRGFEHGVINISRCYPLPGRTGEVGCLRSLVLLFRGYSLSVDIPRQMFIHRSDSIQTGFRSRRDLLSGWGTAGRVMLTCLDAGQVDCREEATSFSAVTMLGWLCAPAPGRLCCRLRQRPRPAGSGGTCHR